MRAIIILLIVANLAFFGYTRLDSASNGEAVRLSEQVEPDKIRLLTPQQVAALGPAKVAALADVCVEWGPFVEADRARALADLEPLALGKLLTQRKTESTTAYWIYLPPTSRIQAEARLSDAKGRGIAEASMVDVGGQRFSVSLGAFRDEDTGKARLAEIAQLGLTYAKFGPRQQVTAQTTFVIRDPQAVVVAKVRDLAPAYKGSDVKVGACEKS